MAKTKGSCFRIMACAGGDSTATGRLIPQENKASSDKCWWSFRKRSEPRVLSNYAVLEPESVGYSNNNMEANNFNSAANACVSENASFEKKHFEALTERQALSYTAVNSEVSSIIAARNSTSNDENIQESAAIIIQTAIRRHLGLRKLTKDKYVIKLQAVVRGHLVRVRAVGALRCIRAIIKMQAIVRARFAVPLQEKVAGKGDDKLERNRNGLYLLEKGNYCKRTRSFYSTGKLFSNKLAQQLLASTPKTKPIYIRTDPSESDAAWEWLERWMTLITPFSGEENVQIFAHTNEENGNSINSVDHDNEKNSSANSKSSISELTVESESEGNANASIDSNLLLHSAAYPSGSCISLVENDEQGQYQSENQESCMKQQQYIDIEEVSKQSVSFCCHLLAQSALSPQQTDDYSSNKTESIGTNLINTTQSEHYGSSEVERQKVAVWLRRPCNPSFAAAQSKFEEMSSNSKNVRCINSFSSTYQDHAADGRIDNYLSQVKKSNESGLTENIPSHDPIIQVAASECGTEISISSTLDSPDISETECGEIILEISPMDKLNYDANFCSNNVFILGNMGAESHESELNKVEETVMDPSLSCKSLDLSPPAQQASEVQGHVETANFQQDKTSAEGTPRSCTAAVKPFGTPTSEVLVNGKSKNKDGNTPIQKQRPTESGRKLAARVASDSAARHCSEHLLNDPKNEKRRHSAGVFRTDLDNESRVSNCNSRSLPSYMQATKSARAKVHASNSPKSSPDLHDKDNHIKKRNSLPIGNGKQDSSPPKQRSTPRAQQNTKFNAETAMPP